MNNNKKVCMGIISFNCFQMKKTEFLIFFLMLITKENKKKKKNLERKKKLKIEI